MVCLVYEFKKKWLSKKSTKGRVGGVLNLNGHYTAKRDISCLSPAPKMEH